MPANSPVAVTRDGSYNGVRIDSTADEIGPQESFISYTRTMNGVDVSNVILTLQTAEFQAAILRANQHLLDQIHAQYPEVATNYPLLAVNIYDALKRARYEDVLAAEPTLAANAVIE